MEKYLEAYLKKQLINNDSESGSSKNISAKKLSIPIITEEEFIKKYGVSAE